MMAKAVSVAAVAVDVAVTMIEGGSAPSVRIAMIVVIGVIVSMRDLLIQKAAVVSNATSKRRGRSTMKSM